MGRNRKIKMTSGPSTKGQIEFRPLSGDPNPRNGVTIQGPDSVGASPLNLTLPSSVVADGVYKDNGSGVQSVSKIVNANIDAAAAIDTNKLAALTADKATATDGSGKLTTVATTRTELGHVAGVTSAIQTQLDSKAASASLTAHEAATAAHGATGAVVGTTNTQTLTNKTLTSPTINTPVIDVQNLTEQGSTPSTPSSGTTKLYSKTDGKLYKLSSNGIEQAVGTGSGSGGINYISNPDAETDTLGWSTYADAAGSEPVDGTGGSPNVTFTRSTVSPLRSLASFLLSKDAANRQGQGVSYAFSIDAQDKSKRLQIEFDYAGTANFVAGESSDVKVFIYDVTNATLIRPERTYLLNGSGTYISVFDATTSTSYRLILHVASTSALAYDLKIDNVKVAPRTLLTGPSISDMVTDSNFTPSAGFGTVTNKSIQRGRTGDKLHVTGFLNAGTVAASVASLTLPFTIDGAKLSSTANVKHIGYWYQHSSAANANIYSSDKAGVVFYDGSTTDRVFFAKVQGSGVFNKDNVSTLLANNEGISFEFSVPISDWTSNTAVTPSGVIRMSEVLANGTRVTANPTSLGQYRTYVKAINAVTGSDNAPATAPSVSNGMQIYSVPYNVAGTSGQTNRWEIFVGKFKSVKTQFYSSTGRTGWLDADLKYVGADSLYGIETAYDPVTGVYIMDTMEQSGGVTTRGVGVALATAGAGSTFPTNCYFDIYVSDNDYQLQMQQERSEVWVYGDGATSYGSTNTKIRRFGTVGKNTGSGITYADSATDGASFTINESGIYHINYSDRHSAAEIAGISVNSSQLTTSIEAINAADRRAVSIASGSSDTTDIGVCLYLSKGDVVRAHTRGAAVSATTTEMMIRITKVS